jgi:hypothetical protein
MTGMEWVALSIGATIMALIVLFFGKLANP